MVGALWFPTLLSAVTNANYWSAQPAMRISIVSVTSAHREQ